MKKNSPIQWQSDFTKRTFHDLGLGDASKFWRLRNGDLNGACELVRELGYGENTYSTIYMKINKSKYRLKRASGRYFDKLLYEKQVLKHLPELHLTPPQIISESIDEKTKQCFILFKYPPGFIVIKNLLEYNLHPTIIADFEVRKKGVMKKISKALHKMHYSDFYYPHLYSDHILVKNQGDEIAIVDLEDFLPLKRCPWYYHLEPCAWLVRKKEWRTLRKSLASGIFTHKYMKSLLK